MESSVEIPNRLDQVCQGRNILSAFRVSTTTTRCEVSGRGLRIYCDLSRGEWVADGIYD